MPTQSDTATDTDTGTDSDEGLSTSERRARVLGIILRRGHPDLVSRTDLAERFGVHASTITRDIEALADDIPSDGDPDRHAAYNRAVRELVDEGRYVETIQLIESWDSALFDAADDAELPEAVQQATRDGPPLIEGDSPAGLLDGTGGL